MTPNWAFIASFIEKKLRILIHFCLDKFQLMTTLKKNPYCVIGNVIFTIFSTVCFMTASINTSTLSGILNKPILNGFFFFNSICVCGIINAVPCNHNHTVNLMFNRYHNSTNNIAIKILPTSQSLAKRKKLYSQWLICRRCWAGPEHLTKAEKSWTYICQKDGQKKKRLEGKFNRGKNINETEQSFLFTD